jgi:hypothetical protein
MRPADSSRRHEGGETEVMLMQFSRAGWVLCLAVAMAAGPACAAGSSGGVMASSSAAMQKLGAGTKKVVKGTVDVLTLRPLWDKKPETTTKTRGYNVKKSAAKKKSSWFSSDDSSKSQTMKDFVGAKRPG